MQGFSTLPSPNKAVAGVVSPPEWDGGRHEEEGGSFVAVCPALSLSEGTITSPGYGYNKDVLARPPKGEGHPLETVGEVVPPEHTGKALQEDHAIDCEVEQL